MTLETSLTRENGNGQEYTFPVTVEYSYIAGMKGLREHGTGLQLSPDDVPEVQIESVVNSRGVQVDMTREETQKIEGEVWEHLEANADDGYDAEAAYAYRYDKD